MNDANDPLSDEAIDDLLGPLRTANLPDELRSSNRDAVRRALERRARPPWWQRSIAVPVPLAIAASLALFVTAAAALWPTLGQAADKDTPVPRRESVVESDTAIPRWSVTRSYILSIESLAQFQNSFLPEATEDRNES
jgi:hypothetical protein